MKDPFLQPRDKVVYFRVTRAELQQLEEAAGRSGRGVSEFIRGRLSAVLRPNPDSLTWHELREQLCEIQEKLQSLLSQQ